MANHELLPLHQRLTKHEQAKRLEKLSRRAGEVRVRVPVDIPRPTEKFETSDGLLGFLGALSMMRRRRRG